MDNLKESLSEKPSTTNNYLLFLAVVISVLNHYLSALLNYILYFKNKLIMSSYCLELKTRLEDLQRESAQIDMTDEFAKYARLQRKIIKIQDELKKEVSAQKDTDMKNKMILRVIVGLVCIVFMYNYNAQPVVRMPVEWFSPIENILCWPGGEPGTISFLLWCAISNSVVKTFS